MEKVSWLKAPLAARARLAELLEGPDEPWGRQRTAFLSAQQLPAPLSWAACEVAECSWLV